MQRDGRPARTRTVRAAVLAVAVATSLAAACSGGSSKPAATTAATAPRATAPPRPTTTVRGAAIRTEICSLLRDAEVRALMGTAPAAPGTPRVAAAGTASACSWTGVNGSSTGTVDVRVTTGANAGQDFARLAPTANAMRVGRVPARLQLANAAAPAIGSGQIDVLVSPRALLTIAATNTRGVSAARLTAFAQRAVQRLRLA